MKVILRAFRGRLESAVMDLADHEGSDEDSEVVLEMDRSTSLPRRSDTDSLGGLCGVGTL